MKKIRKVGVLEVKRTLVVSQLVRKQKSGESNLKLASIKAGRRLLKPISLGEFKRRLKISKAKVLSLSEKRLGKIIFDDYKGGRRLKAYNDCDWYLGEVNLGEVGVWRRVGGLPLGWTNGSLKETAQRVKNAMNKNSKLLTRRVRYTVSNMLETNVQELQKEKYLLPIMFEGGAGTRGRKRLRKQTEYDIDDGCMRSIALAISGKKIIRAYIGFPKKD